MMELTKSLDNCLTNTVSGFSLPDNEIYTKNQFHYFFDEPLSRNFNLMITVSENNNDKVPQDGDDLLSQSAASLSIPSLAEDWNSPEDKVWDKDEG